MFADLAGAGSRYIYDLYYEKEAISKQLYDWLLKNGYADANLIAKWKKQGYEKVRGCSGFMVAEDTDECGSFVASDAYRRKRPTSTRPAFAASPGTS